MTASREPATSEPASDRDFARRIEQRRSETIAAIAEIKTDVDRDSVRLYTALDVEDHDYLTEIGLPGEYPFTAWLYPTPTPLSGGTPMRISDVKCDYRSSPTLGSYSVKIREEFGLVWRPKQ